MTAELRGVDAEASRWAGAVETDCSDEALMRAIEKLGLKLIDDHLGRRPRPPPPKPRPPAAEAPPKRLPPVSRRHTRKFF